MIKCIAVPPANRSLAQDGLVIRQRCLGIYRYTELSVASISLYICILLLVVTLRRQMSGKRTHSEPPSLCEHAK